MPRRYSICPESLFFMRELKERVPKNDKISYGVAPSSLIGIKEDNNLHQSGSLTIHQKVHELAQCDDIFDLAKLEFNPCLRNFQNETC
jgi:hypothetical protein